MDTFSKVLGVCIAIVISPFVIIGGILLDLLLSIPRLIGIIGWFIVNKPLNFLVILGVLILVVSCVFG